jgi:hypothetical protein
MTNGKRERPQDVGCSPTFYRTGGYGRDEQNNGDYRISIREVGQ